LDAYLVGGHGTPVEQYAANFMAHEVLVATTSLTTQLGVIDALAAAGVHRIQIPMGQMPFRHPELSPGILAIYDAIVTRIRLHGIELGIWITFSEAYYSVTDLSEWTGIAEDMVDYIVDRYDPDVMSIVHEPTTVSERLGETPTVLAWSTYMTDVAAAAVAAGATRVSASFVVPSEAAYLTEALTISDITDVGLDIYTIEGLAVGTDMAADAIAASREVSIDETWRPSFSPATSESLDAAAIQYVGHPPFVELDVKWVRAMNKWAAANGVTGITPIWTQNFFAYGAHGSGAFDASLTSAVETAIANGTHQGVYDIVADLVEEGA
jgi:hypothetical protein